MSCNALRFAFAGVVVVAVLAAVAGQARADDVLGVPLPAATIASTFTGGGAPAFADTFVTPYSSVSGGLVASWKAEFGGGLFPPIGPDDGGPLAGGPGVPVAVQLKVFRRVSPTTLQVVAAGVVHDPRPVLQARFGASYPFFRDADAVVEFGESNLLVQPGDLVGLTITSDSAIGRYEYLLVGNAETPLVQRDVALGGSIDLSDIYTGSLPWPPAIEVHVVPAVTTVPIDIKPGGYPNSINLGSSGDVPVAILSSASFDATTVDPRTVTLAGAPVALKPNGSPMSAAADVDGDGRLDLVLHVATRSISLSATDTRAVLNATTFDGTRVTGSDSVSVVG